MEGRYIEIDVEYGDSFVYTYKVEMHLLEISQYDSSTNRSYTNIRIGSYEEAVLLTESKGKSLPVRLKYIPVCFNRSTNKLTLDKKWKCIWRT